MCRLSWCVCVVVGSCVDRWNFMSKVASKCHDVSGLRDAVFHRVPKLLLVQGFLRNRRKCEAVYLSIKEVLDLVFDSACIPQVTCTLKFGQTGLGEN